MDDAGAVPKPGQRRARNERAPTTPDPIEIAMEAESSGTKPSGVAYEVLAKQSVLLDADLRHRRWQIASERAGYGLKVLIGLGGLVIAISLAAMAWHASQAKGLVIEPFAVPPEMAQRGLSGEVVASQVLDKLAGLAATNSIRRADSISNDWGRDIKVAIPSTGITLGDLQGALKQWLGHETRVTGEVYRGKAGAVLSVRLAGQPAFTATGDEQDIDALTSQVAEQILKASQPYRYQGYLSQHGRFSEAVPYMQWVAQNYPDDHERAWAWRSVARSGFITGDIEGARSATQEAIRLAPRMSMAWQLLSQTENALGRTEASLTALRKAADLRPVDRDLEPWARTAVVQDITLANELGDFTTVLTKTEVYESNRRYAANNPQSAPLWRITGLAGLHEITAARRSYDASNLGIPIDAPVGGVNDAGAASRGLWIIMVSAEDWPGMITMSNDPAVAALPSMWGGTPVARRVNPTTIQLAYAKMMTGDPAGAAAILDPTPADCVRCLVGRGQLAAAKGDAAGADRWFSEAMKAAPSVPQPAFEWGRVKLARGDAAGAIKLFDQAHKKGPHWAEPLKFEADALAAQGKAAKAAALYAQAAERAPRWGGLHFAWGSALARAGKLAEARTKWQAAAAMDLLPAERAELARVQRS